YALGLNDASRTKLPASPSIVNQPSSGQSVMTNPSTDHRRQAAHRLGLDAESRAAAFLRGKKFRILAERLCTAGGEIDVLALDGKTTLVVVEVKARATLDDSLYSITPAKRKRLI